MPPPFTPNNILRFMDNNIVKVTGDEFPPYVDKNKKIVWISLDPLPGYTIQNKPDGQVYLLEFLDPTDGPNDPNGFLAYWVEYHPDGDGVPTWLGKEVPYMFTAIMNGCSFGLGSQTYDGVLAAHVNSKSASLTGAPDAPQIKSQKKKLKALNLATKIIDPATYLGPFDRLVMTTPFGVRAQLQGDGVHASLSLPWRCCWQKYRSPGKQMIHMGVKTHSSGLFS